MAVNKSIIHQLLSSYVFQPAFYLCFTVSGELKNQMDSEKINEAIKELLKRIVATGCFPGVSEKGLLHLKVIGSCRKKKLKENEESYWMQNWNGVPFDIGKTTNPITS